VIIASLGFDAARSSLMLGFGTWPDFLLQVVADSFFSREPVPANLDAFDLTFAKELAQMTGRETTNSGSLRD
jgi:hypothetical protein